VLHRATSWAIVPQKELAIRATQCYIVLMSDTKHISIRIPSDVLAEVDAQAAADGRSRSQVIVRRLAAVRWSGPSMDGAATTPQPEPVVERPEQRVIDAAVDRATSVSPLEALLASGKVSRGAPETAPAEAVEMCPHTEYDDQSGDTYACALPAGHKGKCRRGCRL